MIQRDYSPLVKYLPLTTESTNGKYIFEKSPKVYGRTLNYNLDLGFHGSYEGVLK